MTAKLKEQVAAFQEAWTLLFGADSVPEPRQWCFWLLKHDESTLRAALTQLAKKHLEHGTMDAAYMGRFLSSVASRMTKAKRDEQEADHAFRLVMDSYLASPGTIADANRVLDLLENGYQGAEQFLEKFLDNPNSPSRLEALKMLKRLWPNGTFADMHALVAEQTRKTGESSDSSQGKQQ